MGLLNSIKKVFSNPKPNINDKEYSETNTLKTKVETSYNDEINPIYKTKLTTNLFPGEIVLLDWISEKNIGNDYPKYFSYKYGIDPDKSSKKLIEQGYLEYASALESISSLKISELKEILRDNDLKLSGNKANLIKRIQGQLTEDAAKKYIKDLSLNLTSQGEEVFKEFYYVIPAHKNGSKDGVYNVASAIDFVNNFKGSFTPLNRDISWGIYQREYLNEMKKRNFGMARNIVLSMAKQVEKEGNKKYALFFYFRVFIYDLRGMSNSNHLDRPVIIRPSPGIIDLVNILIKDIKINEDEILKTFTDAWDTAIEEFPFHLFNKNKCYQCLLLSLNNDMDTVEQYVSETYNNIDKNEIKNKYGIDSLPDYFES